jgi:hypothetical protein
MAKGILGNHHRSYAAFAASQTPALEPARLQQFVNTGFTA